MTVSLSIRDMYQSIRRFLSYLLMRLRRFFVAGVARAITWPSGSAFVCAARLWSALL